MIDICEKEIQLNEPTKYNDGKYTLNEIAKDICRNMKYIHDYLRYSLGYALDIGKSLIKVKGQIPHGDYLKWIKEKTYLSERTGILNDFQVIIDIKTGVKQKWHGAQLSGYKALINSEYKLFGLYLHKDGKYRLESYKDSEYRNIFMCALSIYTWKRR